MKVLFIGGTGFISTAVSRMAIARGIELFHLNRGQRKVELAGVEVAAGGHQQRGGSSPALADHQFDVVVDWIAYHPNDIERDLALFRGRTKQFVFISSASAYQKPPTHYRDHRVDAAGESVLGVFAQQDRLRGPAAGGVSRERFSRDDRAAVADVRSATCRSRIGGWGCYTFIDRLKQGKPIHRAWRRLVAVGGDACGRFRAAGFLGLLGNEQAIGHAFHITTDEVLTWNQIYTTIAEAVGVEPKLVHISSEDIIRVSPEHYGGLLGDKAWSVVFDNSKIKQWVPGFPVHDPLPRRHSPDDCPV